MRSRTVGIALAGLALLVLAIVLFHNSMPDTTRPAVAPDPHRTEADASSQVPPSAVPSDDTPLRDVLSRMGTLAKTGNSHAACRIAQDIVHCNNASNSLDAADILANIPRLPGQKESLANQILRQSEGDLSFCSNVPASALSDAYQYQKTAANNGDRKFARWLVTMPALSQEEFLTRLDDWKDYRKRAKEYFDRSLAEHNGEDLSLLLMTYAPTKIRTLRPPYKVNDPMMFLALYQIARQRKLLIPAEVVDEAARMGRTLDSEETSQLNALVQRLSGGWEVKSPERPPFSDYTEVAAHSFCE